MNIRPAQPGDLPALLEIFAHARAFMAQTGNPTQWPATYPGAELMQQQIARGVCYVLEGNARPEATFCYIPGPEPTYAEIYDGGWPDDAPYATIHRMASAGRVHGAAAICFAWCAARGLPVSSRPPYLAPTPAATQKPVETLRFQPVLVRLQELESWAL